MLATATTTLMLLLGVSSAQAQETTPIFVAPFEATHPEAAGLASMLPDFLSQQLAGGAGLSVVMLSDIGKIYDVPAASYAESCPEGEFVGCAYVLGEAGGARYALTGRVTAYEDHNQVDLRVVDVDTAVEIVNIDIRYLLGDDDAFAAGVVQTVRAISDGRLKVGDLRSYRREVATGPDKEQAASELSDLDREIGDVDSLDVRDGGLLEEEEYTLDDLAADMESEGTKPWERLDMSPREFLRYKSSGVPLYEWREMAKGRKGRLLVRGMAGFGRVPNSGSYYGRVALSSETLQVIETYAYQSFNNTSGLQVAGGAAYGLTPTLDVGVNVGLSTGSFAVDIDRITVGNVDTSPEPEVFNDSRSIFVGPQVLFVPIPTSTVRPVIGGFSNIWLGARVNNHILPPEELPNGGVVESLGSPGAVSVGAIGGGELSLGDTLDLWMHVPFGVVVSSWNTPDTYSQGDSTEDLVQRPDELGLFNAGVQFGVQVRLGGTGEKKTTLDDYE